MKAEKDRPWRYQLTYLYTSIWDIPSWVVLILMRLLWGKKLHWLDGVWFEIREGSWLSRRFKGWSGVTFGHGGFYGSGVSGGKGIDTKTEFHEHVHVEWYESSMLRAFILGLAVFSISGFSVESRWTIASLAIWFLGAVLAWVPNWIQAWMRGENVYQGSTHEEAAYALAREYEKRKTGVR